MSASAVQPDMKRDGRKVSRAALEEMRLMALDRMREGESPADVAASFGLHRGWAYKVLARAKGQGRGKRALLSRKATGRPRTLTPAQERQVEPPRLSWRLFGLSHTVSATLVSVSRR
ncbi:winged helix-turn helix protein [Pseudofulvimonas gallinarii]|uniref:Winged helix-turn helix protein n=1 Tax=Pseudofulvimonas gallinarii TaxID=634155 RepID=A0A4R3LED0_9GAMM|nr:winged helix-turn helix protein [Pseudofulvimonas gallinarii]